MYVRAPAVAGVFYPAQSDALRERVQSDLSAAKTSPQSGTERWPKAIIAPHAGFSYSGPIAGSAFAQLAPARKIVKRVIIIGPCHRVPVARIAASSASEFVTPLGSVPVDRAAMERILALPQVKVFDEAHAPEHSIETHLPFLQLALDEFSIVPLIVGDTDPRDVAEVLENLWGGPETLISISSDLSHFHDYDTARSLDSHTAAAVEASRPEDIQYHHACGRIPINGLLSVSPKHQLKAATVDLRNSGDTIGPRDQVVGYGAWGFYG